jgi:serine/threonine-protein kinase
MTPEEFARIRELFDRAMALPPAERSQFVENHAPRIHRSELLAMVLAGDDSKFLASAFATGLLDQVRPAGDAPAQIGHYKILRELGRGGMGVVYMALRNDDVFNKVVALKVISDTALAGTGLIERFKQERQILAGLDHPNIARILDGGNTPDGRPFYVMEYVAGSPIDDYCARMNVDVPTRVRMMAQACDAIEYLHKNAVAHRDLKPQNILVTLDGLVKLVDFGIAKVESAASVGASAMAGQPTMIMTPGYASPEQLTGESSGKTSDIYSLAVVLYQLLTGRLPYSDQEGRPNLKAQLSGNSPEPPSKAFSKTPKPPTHVHEPKRLSYPDLDRVLLTALQRDPLQRYPTVDVFADDLRRCLDGRPIAAHPSTWTYRFGKLIGRNRVAAALAVVAVLMMGGGAWLVIGTQMERVRLQAKEEELERFVSLLSAKVNTRWQQSEELVPATEKVADVQAANRIMASDTVRELSQRAPDPARVKQLIASLRGVLEKADDLSRGQAPLRKEIAKVFRQIGDFESSAPLAQLTDKQQAVRSYQRAAVIAADIQSVDSVWAAQQMSELSGLLQGLGSTFDVLSPTAQADATSAPTPEPAAVSRRATADIGASEPAVQPVDVAAREEIRQRLRTTTLDAERARRGFEMLRDSLASRGQTIRSDIEATLTAAEGLLEDAKNLLEANELEMAEDCVRRAGYQLRKVFQAVGG